MKMIILFQPRLWMELPGSLEPCRLRFLNLAARTPAWIFPACVLFFYWFKTGGIVCNIPNSVFDHHTKCFFVLRTAQKGRTGIHRIDRCPGILPLPGRYNLSFFDVRLNFEKSSLYSYLIDEEKLSILPIPQNSSYCP
jgi:hypothetical protein